MGGANLVAVAQVAVALPAGGAGAAEAGGGLGDGGSGARGRVLVLAADEFGLRRRALLHLPQACGEARCHGDAAVTNAR